MLQLHSLKLQIHIQTQSFKLLISKTEKLENPLIRSIDQENPHWDSRARRVRSGCWHVWVHRRRRQSKHCPTVEKRTSIMTKKGTKTAQSCSPIVRELDLCDFNNRKIKKKFNKWVMYFWEAYRGNFRPVHSSSSSSSSSFVDLEDGVEITSHSQGSKIYTRERGTRERERTFGFASVPPFFFFCRFPLF